MPLRPTLLAAALASLSGCSLLPSWTEIDPPAPVAPPAPPPPPPPLSRVQIPVRVDLQSLAHKVGAMLPDSLVAAAFEEDFGTGGPDRPSCGVACGYRVLREEAATLSAEGRTLELSLGLRYGFSCQRRFPCFGPKFTLSCGWDGEPNRLRLRISTDVEVRKDWTTGLRTRLDSLANQGTCRIRRLPLYVPDRLIAVIYNNYDKASPRVDSVINDQIALRKRVEKAWRRISQPIPMGKDGWIVLNPEAVTAPQPRIDKGILRMDLGLTARPRIYVGETPAPAMKPLPDIGEPSEGDGFRVHVPVRIGYAEINAILRGIFRTDSGGFRIPAKGRPRILVDRIELSGFGERVLLKMHFHGAVRGNVFLIGMPRFNPVTYALTIEDLDLEVRSHSPLLKAAKWLGREELTEAIERRLILRLHPTVLAMTAKLKETLQRKFELVRLDGTLDDVNFSRLRFSNADSALTIYVEALGRLEARVEE